jgi:hypothetical protein
VQAELTADVDVASQHEELPLAAAEPLLEPEPPPAVIPEAPVQVVANQLGDVAADAGRLLDLQMKLFQAECVQSGKQLITPVALLAGTGVLTLAVTVVLLLAIGTGLQELSGWPLSVCWLLVGVLGIGVAYGVVRYALELLKTPRISFEKSREELMRNVAALSKVLKPR